MGEVATIWRGLVTSVRCSLLLMPVLVLAYTLVDPSASAADRSGTVRDLLEEGRAQDAQKRCGKWSVLGSGGDAEGDLVEACAQVALAAARLVDDISSYSAVRATWRGTDAARQALQREAELVFAALGDAPALVDLSRTITAYNGTPAAVKAAAMIPDVSVRAAETEEAAVAAARQWPDHPGVPGLVEQFPRAFLRVEVRNGVASARLDPPVAMPRSRSPKVRWVGVRDGVTAGGWDELVAGVLEERGIAGTLPVTPTEPASSAPTPKHPLCFDPALLGAVPAVEARLGESISVETQPWTAGCGPDAWPVVTVWSGDALVGLSVRPGHLVQPGSTRTPDGPYSRDHTGALLGAATGPVSIGNGRLLQAYLKGVRADPLDGGPPGRLLDSPEPSSPLSRAASVAPYNGWTATDGAKGHELTGPALTARGSTAVAWLLPAGEVRVLTPLVQHSVGLVPLATAGPPTPPLPEKTAWRLDEGIWVRPEAPSGATRLKLGDDMIVRAEMLGLGSLAKPVVVHGAWTVNMGRPDDYGEAIGLVTIGDKGTWLVVGERGTRANLPAARVFLRVDEEMAEAKPFAFTVGKHAYVAWTTTVSPSYDHFINMIWVLRREGDSYALDSIERWL